MMRLVPRRWLIFKPDGFENEQTWYAFFSTADHLMPIAEQAAAFVPDEFSLYAPPSGRYDEMCPHPGEARPHWAYFIQALKAMGSPAIEQRRQQLQGLLRDNGVTYNAYGDPQGRDRPWQLDLLPLLLPSEEWSRIERGLIQRAELLNLILADLYGDAKMFRNRLIPLEFFCAHPGFLRQAVGIEAPHKQYLPLYAADLARDGNGQMHVLRDHTQAPVGAGYALENRMVMSRVFPSLYRDSHVHRLALFFRVLRTTLANMSWRAGSDGQVVVLSAGPDSESYFEHAYLAKYLGYPLVQGADLTVRDGKAWLKTLDGLQPVDVILRRVSDEFSDPLELRPDSYIGVAGLLQASRLRHVALANPLGTAALENPALNQFLPALARYFLGEDLHLPGPPTWWCGSRQERDYVLANLDKLVIRPTLQRPGATVVRGALLEREQLAQLRARIMAEPHRFVGQEEISRSTVPAWQDGCLAPRQMVLRAFLTASGNSYVAMPGGLARVSAEAGHWEISSESGGMTKDIWVLASEPEKQISLLPAIPQPATPVEIAGELPSRVAESLYWLGRYAERSEGIVRLLRAVLLYLVEQPSEIAQNRAILHSLLRALTYLTETYPGFVGDGAAERLAAPEAELLSVFLERNRTGSLAYNLGALLYAARSVRDRISPDIWRVFNDIHADLDLLSQAPEAAFADSLNAALGKLNHLVTAFAAFSGLAMDSMTHGQGWRFLSIGRRLERAYHIIHLLRSTLCSIVDNEAALLEHVLNICDSQMTYRRRYRSQAEPLPVLELLLSDQENPRAVHFQLRELEYHLRQLPRKSRVAYRSPEEKLALEALTQLRLKAVEELVKPDSTGSFRALLDQLLVGLGHLLPRISDALSESYFSHADRPSQLVSYLAD
jgi:uncharacterized circularly permuted ATP-grasp superfamily protein/uncharacterized alpha-E superfamily protein